jgi:hypothetical protein
LPRATQRATQGRLGLCSYESVQNKGHLPMLLCKYLLMVLIKTGLPQVP